MLNSEINNTQKDNTKHAGVAMPMYNIVIIIQKHLNSPGNSALFKFKPKITGTAGANDTNKY